MTTHPPTPVVSLTLPWPPTTNNLHAVMGGRKVLSIEGRRYKVWAQAEARRQWPQEPLQGGLCVTYHLYWPRKGDWDNFIKAAQDACKGIVWRDDSQIREAHVYTASAEGNPRVEVTIRSL